MILYKVIASLLMTVGLMAVWLPRIPGTLIILSGAVAYGTLTNFQNFTPTYMIGITALLLAAEFGGRWLRLHVTKREQLTRQFAVGGTGGGITALIVSDLLFGPTLGTLIWQVLVGKTLIPRGRAIGKILFQIMAVALYRFVLGLIIVAWTILQLY